MYMQCLRHITETRRTPHNDVNYLLSFLLCMCDIAFSSEISQPMMFVLILCIGSS